MEDGTEEKGVERVKKERGGGGKVVGITGNGAGKR